MKVYLVQQGWWEGMWICGVYSSLTAANKAAAEAEEKNKPHEQGGDFTEVAEWEVMD